MVRVQLQDRTQFSDGDLIQLKRYWDRGMTSLGSVCREKITAAANQLSVDTEIVKVETFPNHQVVSKPWSPACLQICGVRGKLLFGTFVRTNHEDATFLSHKMHKVLSVRWFSIDQSRHVNGLVPHCHLLPRLKSFLSL